LDRSEKPLRPAMLWNDGRATRECLELEHRQPLSRSLTGNIMMPGFTAPKLLWVSQHQPEIFARTAKVLLAKDYVRLRLTGESVSDMSDASGTGWLDVADRDWSDPMLAATGLNREHMPRLVEGVDVSGNLRSEVAAQLQLPSVVVAGGAGDSAATAMGMGVVSPGQAFLSLGTYGVLFVVTDRFRPSQEKVAHAFCHCLPNRWHQMAVTLSAVSALEWVAQLTGESNLQRLVDGAQARGLHRNAPYFLPYLSGERTPHNDPNSRGVFFGLNAETTRDDLVLAVMEGVAFAFADGLDVLLEAGGVREEVTVTGAGARLSYWGQLLAAVLDRPLTYRSGNDVAAAMGAARLGRIAASRESTQTVCTMPPIAHAIEPDRALRTLLAERRGLFVQLYRDLQDCFMEFAT